MATTGTLMTANNIYGLVNPPTDPSANDPLAHQTINSGATNWGSHVDLSNAVVRLTTNQTIAGDKTFTGTVVAPTPVQSDNTTKIATTAFVKTSIDNLVDSAPNNLNTLNELAAAINDDNNFHNTVTTALSGKHPSITSSARLNSNLIGDNGNVSNTEFGYLDGVTSSIQTQINGKQNVIGEFTRLNANLIGDNGNVGNTEFGYLDGVTSSIQTQIDSKQATITDGDLTIARTSGLQSALDLKAPLDAPTFTGIPVAPTATAGTNTTQLATTAFVKTAVDNLVGGAPGALDTLNELAAALNDDSSFHTTITNQIATKQDTIGDDDLTIARTNGLQAALDSKQPNITTTSDISLNNIGISGDISSNGGFSFAGHIIPKTNSQYDLGSAEYKIRHLYLSDNSLWLGEEHKIEVSGGQMRFRKIRKNELPTGISNNFGDASLADAIAILGKDPSSTMGDITLADWEHYSVLKGTPLRVDQIFLPDDINDDGGVLGTINGTDVSLNKLEVAKDLSANDISSNNLQIRPGYKLYADTINETTNASGVTVDSVLLKDGDISANGMQLSNLVVRSGGFLFANTINETTNGSGVTVDSVLLKDGGVFCNDICGNDISANDISSNNLQVNGGGELFVDKISESTDSSGVTIDSVLLKDNIVTAHTVTAQNYSVGGTNFISASRQGNFRDLEVKNSSNQHTILLTGDGGDISIDGTLSADTIGEKTSATGVTIDGVLLKDNDISANDISSNNLQVRAGYKLYVDTIDESSAGTGVTIDGVLLKDNNVTCTDLTASGTTTVTTQSATDNSTKIATTAFVKTAIDNLIDGAPGTMDTLKELSTALDNNNSYATTITLQLAQKAPKADPTFTGTPLAPTATAGTNTTQLATTAFVQTAISGKQATLTAGSNITISGTTISATTGSTTLSSLTDVNLTNVASGHSFVWNGSSMVPSTITAKMASIEPLANDTYSLGSPTNVWKDVYIGPGSLYIDGQKVIESASSTIIMGADANQNLKIKGSGSGQVQIEAESNNISIQTTGTGDVVLGSTGSGIVRFNKNIVLSSGVEISNISDAVVKINDGLDVTGTVKIGNYTLPTAAGTSGQVLKYPSSGSTLEWGDSAASLSSSSANELSDISFNTSSVTNGQALVWSSTNSSWEPGTVASSGGSSVPTISGRSIINVANILLNYGYVVTASVNEEKGQSHSHHNASSVFHGPQYAEHCWSANTSNKYYGDNGNGLYTGSTSTTVGSSSINGEWIQINFNKKVKVYHAIINSQPNRLPKDFTIAGSNDGTNWTLVHEQNGTSDQYSDYDYRQDWWSNNRNRLWQKVTFSTAVTFEYLRLIVENQYPSTDQYVWIEDIQYYGYFPEDGHAVTLQNSSVSDLSDVSFNTVTATNGQALLWNSTDGRWEPGTVASGGSSGTTNTIGVNMEYNTVTTVHSYLTIAKGITVSNTVSSSTEITQMEISITPMYNDSVINVQYMLNYEGYSNIVFRIVRSVGSTNTVLSPDGGDESGITTVPFDTHNSTTPHTNSIQIYDEPNTTSQVTYKLYIHLNQETDPGYDDFILNGSLSQSNSYAEKLISTVAAIEHPKTKTLVPATSITKKGQVLETLTGVCDGRTVVVESGSYTLENITQGTFMNYDTATFVDFPGSKISYKPPAGTKQVVYKFHFTIGRHAAQSLFGYKLYIDNTEVTSSNRTHGTNDDYGRFITIRYTIDIGTDDFNNFKLLSWNTTKELKIKVAQGNSSSGYDFWLNKNYYELDDGVTNDQGSTDASTHVVKPQLELQAIGESSGQVVNLNNNSVSDLSDVSFNTVTATNGQALLWNSTNGIWEPGTVSASSSAPFDSNGNMNGHIIPDANSTYDLGSAEYKIRHLFLSNNSLWVGDNHKIDIVNGKMRFKKRKNNIAPASIVAAGGDIASALAATGVGAVESMTLKHWHDYAKTLNVGGGVGLATIDDLFVSGTTGDWEEDQDIIPSQWITSSSDIYYNSGNVGIGTIAPSYKLDVNGSARFVNDVSMNSKLQIDGFVGINTAPGNVPLTIEGDGVTNAPVCRCINHVNGFYLSTNNNSSSNYAFRCDTSAGAGAFTVLNNHSVGLGVATGFHNHRLRIVGSCASAQIYATGANHGLNVSNTIDRSASSSNQYNRYSAYFGGGGVRVHGYYNSGSNGNIGLRVQYNVYTAGSFESSDRRIKTEIVDVSNNLALTYLRNIPCRYYEYIARPNQTKTVGFIAQEVKEVFPTAVDTTDNFIPNIMQIVSGEWIEREDGNFDFSSNFFTDISSGTYKFHLKEDISSANYIEKDIIMNEDRTFTFENSYNSVFCYGIEVDDFHILNKQKLFALNFSATQELDKKVTELETKVASQETLIQTLISRIEALENN